jgi:hypothetical protein
MNIRIRKETIKPMLEICKMNNDDNQDLRSIEIMLDKLLLHDDYLIEFERYKCAGGPRGSFTVDDYKNVFFNYKTLITKEIENERMRAKLEAFKDFMSDLENYIEGINQLCNIDQNKISEALEWTFYGLPKSVKLDDIEIVLAISLGPSGAWAYNNYSYYDVVFLSKNYDEEVFLNTIAHELHHIGFSKLITDEEAERMTQEELFLIALSGEGLATKFCNNYSGILTKNIYETRINKGIDNYSYKYFFSEFDKVYSMFRNDIINIRNGVYKNTNELMQMFSEHWMSLKSGWSTDERLDDLALSMNYFIGAEIWGLVHDTLGVDEVFKCLKHPQYFLESYNRALGMVNRADLMV